MLTEKEVSEIKAEFVRYERKTAASIDALKIVQRHRGWVSDEVLVDLAGFLEMTAEELESVATFYNFIFRRPVGRHVILVCTSVSCWIVGYESILSCLRERLGIGLGETTPDGRFTLLPNVCLGACDHAPVIMIDDDLHGDLNTEKIDPILEQYE